MRIYGQGFHSESARQRSRSPADSAEADYCEGRIREISWLVRVALVKLAFAHKSVEGRQLLNEGEENRKGSLGHGLVSRSRGHHYGDATSGGCGEINVIHADARTAHHQ